MKRGGARAQRETQKVFCKKNFLSKEYHAKYARENKVLKFRHVLLMRSLIF